VAGARFAGLSPGQHRGRFLREPASNYSPQTGSPDAGVAACADSLTHLQVRSLACSAAPWPRPPGTAARFGAATYGTFTCVRSPARRRLGLGRRGLRRPLACSAAPWPRPPAQAAPFSFATYGTFNVRSLTVLGRAVPWPVV